MAIFPVSLYHKPPKTLPLPYAKYQGINIFARDWQGQLIGGQTRLDWDQNGRYRTWGKEDYGNPNKLPNNEQPLNIARPDELKTYTLGFCEGYLKSNIAAEKHQQVFVGAIGGNFLNCQEQLRKIKNAIKSGDFFSGIKPETLEAIIYIDAGDIVNSLSETSARKAPLGKLINKHKETEQLLTSLGFQVKFAYWEQIDKTANDCDELTPSKIAKIAYLEPDEFYKLAFKLRRQALANKTYFENKSYKADIILNQKYLDYQDFKSGQITFVKSPLGSGKTTNLVDWLDNDFALLEHPWHFLGYRNLLLHQICEKIPDLDHISQIRNSGCGGQAPLQVASPHQADGYRHHVALCVDSLKKILSSCFDQSIIIIDEVVSVIKHLLFSRTIKGKDRSDIIRLFITAINQADRVICLDANLQNLTVNFFRLICPNKTIVTVENQYQPELPKIRFYEGVKTYELADAGTRLYNPLVPRTKQAEKNLTEINQIQAELKTELKPLIDLLNSTKDQEEKDKIQVTINVINKKYNKLIKKVYKTKFAEIADAGTRIRNPLVPAQAGSFIRFG
ncbi:MAG: hypothetical protein HC930_15850 [Hydrococcus sp. SU_1_0]|nr:hypothetical protein [Hydrococcus sp. SU_1_0]